jgi:nitrite reductase (NADH) small subunit
MTPSTTTKTVNLGRLDKIALGHALTFIVEGEPIAVFRQRDGRIFATQNRCPHKQGPLAEGVAGGGKVICPLHGHKFNLETGEGSEKGECVKTYKVSEVNGEMLLQI